jgi:hypothetical protein
MNVAGFFFFCIPLTYALRPPHYLAPCRLSLPMNEHLIQPPVFASSLTDMGPLHGGVHHNFFTSQTRTSLARSPVKRDRSVRKTPETAREVEHTPRHVHQYEGRGDAPNSVRDI